MLMLRSVGGPVHPKGNDAFMDYALCTGALS